MITDIAEIKKKVDKQRDELKSTYNVESLGVFGSVARSENTETSDIDVLVKLSKPIGLFKFIELEEHLTQLFGNKVDLVTQRALKSAIKDEILREVVYV